MDSVLEVEDLRVAYPMGIVAVQGLSLRVPTSGIVGVLGPNGAGKSSTLRAIGGFLKAEGARIIGGVVKLDGVNVVGRSPHEISRLGVGSIPERDKVFASLTVEDNFRSVPMLHGRTEYDQALRMAYDLFPVLYDRRGQPAGLLSGGERQMLAIGRALLLRPRLILADELSFGIAPVLLNRLLDALRQLNNERRMAILLVEQNLDAVSRLAEYVYLIEAGRLVEQGDVADIVKTQSVERAYLGDKSDA